VELNHGEAPSVHFVDERLEGRIFLGGHHFPHVELLEWDDIRLDQNLDGGCNDLIVGIQDFSDTLDFLAFLDTLEEYLGGVSWGHRAPEQCVVVEQHHHVWLDVQITELIEDFYDGHCRIPSREGGVVGHFELCANVLIEHSEACSHDTFEGKEVVLLSNECSINHFDGGWGHPLRIHQRGYGVIWGGKCHPFKKIVGGWIHREARPSMDSTLRAKELGECFDDMFAEGSNVSKIRARLQ
jgi:hypothetical protein